MKKEKKVLNLTMFLNLVVALIKLIGGIVFNFSSLVADSLHSFSDFATDIISKIANSIGKRRATKKYPFGFGMADNIANLVIGLVLFCLAIFILISGFKEEEVVLTPMVFVILIVTILLKLGVICILYFNGKKLGSSILLSSVRESFTDLISSAIVLIVSVLLLFGDKFPILRYADMVGSIIISIIVFYIAINIIKENIEYLIGVNDDNVEIRTKIEKIIDEYKIICDSSFRLMKIGSYYNLYLVIELDDKTSLREVFRLEKKLKSAIKNANLKVRYIEIEPKEYD